MRLYQVQLEVKEATYSYEVATDDFDAVMLAHEHLRDLDVLGPTHIGGYCNIGDVDGPKGVLSYTKTPLEVSELPELDQLRLENQKLKAELAKWVEYSGHETPKEFIWHTDPYDHHYAGCAHNIRSLFQNFTNAEGARLGWGDFGVHTPTLLEVLAKAGYFLREGVELSEKYNPEQYHVKLTELVRELLRRKPLLGEGALRENEVEFFRAWEEATKNVSKT